MRKILILSAAIASLTSLVTAAPTRAEAQYYGGGYYDYRRYGNPSSRDSLNTCAYC